jgi:hypothetical protein
MEVTGKIKAVQNEIAVGASGFRKRSLIVTTEEQYPQDLNLEFVQDKCDLLDAYQPGQLVKVHINLRGREWINPQGEAVYFNTIQGWKIELADNGGPSPQQPKSGTVAPATSQTQPPAEEDDLPF